MAQASWKKNTLTLPYRDVPPVLLDHRMRRRRRRGAAAARFHDHHVRQRGAVGIALVPLDVAQRGRVALPPAEAADGLEAGVLQQVLESGKVVQKLMSPSMK